MLIGAHLRPAPALHVLCYAFLLRVFTTRLYCTFLLLVVTGAVVALHLLSYATFLRLCTTAVTGTHLGAVSALSLLRLFTTPLYYVFYRGASGGRLRSPFDR